jgi:UDP-N-acetyl-2-amino-2-deoxyglucuronate dehydrogenase
MAVDLKKADQLIDACDKNKSSFSSSSRTASTPPCSCSSGPSIKPFRQDIRLYVNVLWQRPQSYYDLAPWRGTKLLDGGAFMNQASHYVDSLLWLGGDIVEVEAFTSTMERKIERRTPVPRYSNSRAAPSAA